MPHGGRRFRAPLKTKKLELDSERSATATELTINHPQFNQYPRR